MRRLINGVAAYMASLAGALRRGWSSFFFTPSDPTTLGLIRAVVGLITLWSFGTYGLDLHDFLGSRGWADPAIVRTMMAQSKPWAWSFWFFVPDAALRAVWLLCMAILVFYTLGLWSRVTAVLAWVIVVSTARRAEVSVFGFDQIITSWLLYVAVTGASGQALSLDRFLARYRQARAEVARRRPDGRWHLPPGEPVPTVSANLALRLIQLHLCLIYAAAGFSKLQGMAWWDGTAIWGMLASPEFSGIDLTWMAKSMWLLNIMTHGTVFLEAGYPVLVWVRPLRPLWLFAVFLLHVGIAITAPGLTIFSAAMLAGNLAFVSGPWLRSLVTGTQQPAGRLLYDGACPRCRASMALVSAADPDHVVEPVDLTAVNPASIHPSLTKTACLRSMHLVRTDGRVVAGYDAVRTLLAWHPLCWPLSLVGSLPGVAGVGRRVYDSLATTRPRDAACTDETCGIHPPRSSARPGTATAEADPKRTQP